MDVESFVEKQRIAGTDTGKVRDRMDALADRVQAQLDSLIAIVSSDPVFGKKFMDDPKGLKYQLEGAVEGTRTMAKSWGKLSDGQFQNATNAEREEQKRREQFENI
ncbi:hypothetical protein [Nocardia bhagyanarayanae]|uniref:Excreted virulence factor EspC (Type VII ESX diderm) n=1 Tax=Nocardia bhagyanarayanae TaxID=1215925 RepID=A0A543F4K9_9NOCA|nr:hypothetical protein [Nocardia bhagyanarayanae]TQM28763.1 hypothetical protein FB390_0337 [Nocardia bhagyanarayanae]